VVVRVDLPAALVSRQPTTPRTGRLVRGTYWAGRSRAVCSPSPRSAVAAPVRPAEGDGGGAGKGGKDGGLAAAFTSTASLHRPHAQPRCTSKRSGRSVCPVAAPGSQGARSLPVKQALRAPAGGVVAEVQRPSCARLWTVWGESWSARGPGVP